MIKGIGITGGIGSGKSYVCGIFEKLGYKVYYADQRARNLMHENPRIVSGVKKLFGKEAYLEDGKLNRPYIGGIVFKDKDKLQALNQIVHPETARDYVEWVQEASQDYDKPFLLKEAAILFESGAYKYSEGVISVYAPKRLRLERVVSRDDTTEEATLDRMDKQWSEWEKYRRADLTIINDGDHLLLPQIRRAIQYFR
ncbi:MAG: dephospho-CoA kinase [Bacteroidota bacterium]